jgi:hypothetical protein
MPDEPCRLDEVKAAAREPALQGEAGETSEAQARPGAASGLIAATLANTLLRPFDTLLPALQSRPGTLDLCASFRQDGAPFFVRQVPAIYSRGGGDALTYLGCNLHNCLCSGQ